MRAVAQMTFALKKEPSGWLIQGWTWTGGKANGREGQVLDPAECTV